MSNFSTYDSTVNSLYLAFYGRPADPAGLAFWSQQLANNNGDLGAITQAFATSVEAQTRFGSDTAGARVTDIYQQLFNRAPDAAGLAFWTNAVEQGNATLAEVSLAILKGAQSSDLDLSTLRQKAADAFTAAVEDGSTEYSGYASIEAARVLVRAVTIDTTDADLAKLVKAAVSFADTATKSPKVVEAIATGSTLLNLYDTARGAKDPVALTQALADTAKAAAGDPVTLESLLRGGGMDKVLKVMPAKATLTDVVEALAKGGLPAAIEVVYPTAPVLTPVPVSDMKIAFLAVTQGEHDTSPDHVTNLSEPLVAFTYRGRELAAGERFEYSLDGVHWTGKGIELVKESYANIISISGIDLTQGKPVQGVQGNALPTSSAQLVESTVDLGTTVYVRAVGASDKVLASSSQQVVYDAFAAAPTLSVALNAASKYFGNDVNHVQSTAQLIGVGLEPGAKVEFLQQSQSHVNSAEIMAADVWSETEPFFNEGVNTFSVRQIDASGNVSRPTEFTFTLDREAPKTPTVTLVADTGKAGDGITSNGTVIIGSLEKSGLTAWEYSTDGTRWQLGGINGETGSTSYDLANLKLDSGRFYVRQLDAAGNISGVQSLNFTLDKIAPENKLSFVGIKDGAPGAFTTGLSEAALIVKYDGLTTDSVEWRVKGSNGAWQAATDNGDASYTIEKIDLRSSDPTIEVRMIDAAGNASAPVEQFIDGPWTKPIVYSNVVRAEYYLEYGHSDLRLFSIPYAVVQATGDGTDAGFLNRDGVRLFDYSNLTQAKTDADYTAGPAFGMNPDTVIRLNGELSLGVYQLEWDKDSIASNRGALAAGKLNFAGGSEGNIVQEGFTINQALVLENGFTYGDSNTTPVSYLLVDKGNASGHIVTGNGHDVIVGGSGGALNIDYAQLQSSSASDLVFGFRAFNDTVTFTGAAAVAIDDNHDDVLDWAMLASSGKTKVEVGHEAVALMLDGPFVTSQLGLAGSDTLKTLNNAIDFSAIAGKTEASGDPMDFLLLGFDSVGDGTALMVFSDKNGNGAIEAGEVALIGVFAGSGPATGDIHSITSLD